MCKTDHYTVFARISSFVDWISTNIAGKKYVYILIYLYFYPSAYNVLEA